MTAIYRPQPRSTAFRINKPLCLRSQDMFFGDPCNGRFDDGISERAPTALEQIEAARTKGRHKGMRTPKGTKPTHRNEELERYRNP